METRNVKSKIIQKFYRLTTFLKWPDSNLFFQFIFLPIFVLSLSYLRTQSDQKPNYIKTLAEKWQKTTRGPRN